MAITVPGPYLVLHGECGRGGEVTSCYLLLSASAGNRLLLLITASQPCGAWHIPHDRLTPSLWRT